MTEKFIVICGVIRYSCWTQQQVDERLAQCAKNGAKEAILFRSETINLTKYQNDTHPKSKD